MRGLLARLRARFGECWHHEPDYTPAGDIILAPEYNERYTGERELQQIAADAGEEGRQN